MKSKMKMNQNKEQVFEKQMLASDWLEFAFQNSGSPKKTPVLETTIFSASSGESRVCLTEKYDTTGLSCFFFVLLLSSKKQNIWFY
jgi:hypothetical protein